MNCKRQGSELPRLLVFVSILRRAFANLFGHLGEFTLRNLLFDGLDIDLMPPVIPEVEPVAESVANFQLQGLNGGFIHTANGRIRLPLLDFKGVWQNIPFRLGVHWAFAERELVPVFFPAPKGVENGFV